MTGLNVGWNVRQTKLPHSSVKLPWLVFTVFQILAHCGISGEFGVFENNKEVRYTIGKFSLTKTRPDEHPDKLTKEPAEQCPTSIDECLINTLRE